MQEVGSSFFFERFGERDWDLYLINQGEILKRTVGYAVFGPPTEQITGTNLIGYDQQRNEHIEKLYVLIWRNRKLKYC